MLRRIKFIADAGQVARSVGMSAVAIAVGVYAMVLQGRSLATVILAVLVLLLAGGAMLQVSRAVRQLRQQQSAVRQAALRAERHYFKVLRRLTAAIEARREHTRGRSKRIGMLVRQIAQRLGLDDQTCRLLYLAGQVHDIGLLSVPDRILNKPARLGGEEFTAIRRHAEVSFRILEPLTFLAEVLPAVRCHHERMNGSGYPQGLAGESVPLPARILAVADAYDAMTHDRPYRVALSQLQALEELRRCCPAGYDARCVAALEEILHLPRLEDTQVLAVPEAVGA